MAYACRLGALMAKEPICFGRDLSYCVLIGRGSYVTQSACILSMFFLNGCVSKISPQISSLQHFLLMCNGLERPIILGVRKHMGDWLNAYC
ncbi:hypothetical protein X945_5768 [Burkholderia pseudomallei ABCPW 107]|nr:hypothetical protein X945_5768 [Burkholderia pseudomallei ABCPW 107]